MANITPLRQLEGLGARLPLCHFCAVAYYHSTNMDHVSSAPLSTDHQSSPDCDICRQVSVPDAVMSAEASTASTHPATNGHCHHSSTGEAAYLIDTKDEDDDNSSGSSELRKSSSLDDWWWWELIASLASFALMATIVIMLINYDGNLAPKLPWAITVRRHTLP